MTQAPTSDPHLPGSDLAQHGYQVVDEVLAPGACSQLIDALPEVRGSGSRTLLAQDAFRALAALMRQTPELTGLLSDLVAIQCTLFQKTAGHNWSVRLHRDAVVAVDGDGPWPEAGVKEGLRCARPPRALLDACVAVRLHLDGAPEGDLCVVPGSHASDEPAPREDATPVTVPRGGALVLRPTLLHASLKLQDATHRRVLHYLFAPPSPPPPYRWYWDV